MARGEGTIETSKIGGQGGIVKSMEAPVTQSSDPKPQPVTGVNEDEDDVNFI